MRCNLTTVQPQSTPSFDPISEADKPLYRFNLGRWFYADEAAWTADIQAVRDLLSRLASLEGKVETDPAALLHALELMERVGILADRLGAYGVLRYAVDTNDAVWSEQGDALWDSANAGTLFVKSAILAMDDSALSTAIVAQPGLEKFGPTIVKWRRGRGHTAPPSVEISIASLGERLNPFSRRFYNLMIARSPAVELIVADRTYVVTNDGDFAETQRLADRDVREAAYRMRLATFEAQGDLYAYALREKALTANALASQRYFKDATDEAAFNSFLSPAIVDAVLAKFRQFASLSARFEIAEAEYQKKMLNLPHVEPWDLSVSPAVPAAPRLNIRDASAAVLNAMAPMGTDYAGELAHLFDPTNGRMDVVTGPNRVAGDFTSGAYGPRSWVFFMQGYGGYLSDIVTLAHEVAHVVHFCLMGAEPVAYFDAEGPRYFTEGFAKVNEIIILQHLADGTADAALKLLYLKEMASKLCSVKFTSMYWAAYATSFEVETYRRIADQGLTKSDEIHGVWEEFGRLWSSGFDAFPAKRCLWAATHHFFDAPLYYSNYLLAWVLAVSVYERMKLDPTFFGRFVDMMKTGFRGDPLTLLKTQLGIDLTDDATLVRMFAMVEDRLSAFEASVAAL